MLATLFLPIMILVAIGWFSILTMPDAPWRENYYSTMFGLPENWVMFACFASPFVFYLWLLGSGNWRRPVLTATIFYIACFFIGVFELVKGYTPPEKRIINLYGIAGTDVYCNGVLLGQTPLHIRVDELIAKVPEWDTPPEQYWYNDTIVEPRLCTWLPWDDFRKERYEASRELFGPKNRNAGSTPKAVKARKEALDKHDADCRYWWSCRFGDLQMAYSRQTSYSRETFEEQSLHYHDFNFPLSPSMGYHAQLLSDVLPELTPEQKADWDRHVLKYWWVISNSLKQALNQAAAKHRNRDKNDPLVELYETALHSTARMKYNISDPVTEDECRRLLAEWVKESSKGYHTTFYFNNDYGGGLLSSRYPSLPVAASEVLLPADNIHESMRKPLTEQWRKNRFRSECGWAPIAYYSWKDKSPDYFAPFARYVAATNHAQQVLLENEAPGMAALFKTLLYRWDHYGTELFMNKIDIYPEKIWAYRNIDNPRVEAEMREYIAMALSDPTHNDSTRAAAEQAAVVAIVSRKDRKDMDRDDLIDWTASLPLSALSKNYALRTLRIRNDENLTFSDRLQQTVEGYSLVETELTLDDVVQWFADHPDDGIGKFLEEQEDNISASGVFSQTSYYDYDLSGFVSSSANFNYGKREPVQLPQGIVMALLRSDTPEGNPKIHHVIRQIAKHDVSVVVMAIRSVYGEGAVQQGRYDADVKPYLDVVFGSMYLPDYILDMCAELSEEKDFRTGWDSTFAPMLMMCDSPKAGEILEKWSSDAPANVRRSWEIWRTRQAFHQRKLEVFEEIVAGRMSPDELLLSVKPWIWKEGRYVQE
jgi:hypothetical protein